MARLTFKRAVTKLIVKLQAYKFNLSVIRTQKCKQRIKNILPLMNEHHIHDENYFGEDYYDESASDEDMLGNRDDPYAEAERLHKQGEKNPVTQQASFIDE